MRGWSLENPFGEFLKQHLASLKIKSLGPKVLVNTLRVLELER